MKNQIFTEKEFESSTYKNKLSFRCIECDNIFYRTKQYIIQSMHRKENINFCSHKCKGLHQNKKTTVICKNCNKSFLKRRFQYNKHTQHFCSQSCAAIYNNTHKTQGYRRSKLEIWIEKQLSILYPNLDIHFNRKDIINSELDIYIPSLKIAFELNGIFHYEPIYSQDQFDKIQNNDQRKFQACIENNISLCIIDTSKQKYFKESTSQKYLDIITNIINSLQT